MPFPLLAIKIYPETNLYGYEYWFEGRSPHYYGPNTCATRQWALDICDPWRDRIWEEVNGPDGTVMISAAFVPGSIGDRIQRADEAAPIQIKRPWGNASSNLRRSQPTA